MIRGQEARLDKLEQTTFGSGGRMIVCRVREGHEDEDLAQAKAVAGVTSDGADLIVLIRKFGFEPTDEPFEPLISIQPM